MLTTNKNPRILLTNDDGIYAPGLKVLEKLARKISEDVWIVAPDRDHSGAGHSLTLKTPLRAEKIKDKVFSVLGTPTDCVLLGVEQLISGKKPDLVLSGVNRGANVAEDITYSGTVAAAMEATLMNIPAIALSQEYKPGHPIQWHTTEKYGSRILDVLLQTTLPSEVFLNVNFPSCDQSKSITGIQFTFQGKRPPFASLIEGIDPRDIPFFWIGAIPEQQEFVPGSDLEALHKNKISITPLHPDLTHHATLKVLQEKTIKV